MYLYFDVNGNLKEIIQEPIREGSINANIIYIYVEPGTEQPIDGVYHLSDYWTNAKINFKLLDSNVNLVNNSLPMTKNTDLQIPFNKNRDLYFFRYGYKYEMWTLELPDNVLNINGIVMATAYLWNSTSQTALDTFNFNVQHSVGIISDGTITDSQYSYLYNQIALINSDRVATKEWVQDQHYLTSATYDYANDLNDLLLKLSQGKKFIVLGSEFEAEVNQRITVPAGTIIVGNGGTFTRAAGFEEQMFWVNEGCELCNFIIDGNRSEMVSPTWNNTIEIALFGNCYIHDIQIIDGNEGIVAYGDFNRVEHCKFTNMGGNAIHFSGGECTVVDGCYVSGANKKSGMGHEDGCIIWSDECRFINCVNNYVEDGLTGFGAIDTYDNSYVKIVNNTIKDCDNSFDLVTSRDQAVDVLIQGNLIINSGKMEMNKTSRSLTAQARYMICNNMLVKSKIEVSRLDTISILGNMILEGTVRLVACTNIKIENNNIKNYSMREVSLECGSCANVSILGNYVRGDYDVINCYDSSSVIIANNKVRAYSIDSSKYAIHTSAAKYANNNEIISYCNGVEISDGYSFTNNIVYLEDDTKDSILEYYGTTYSLIAFNRANGVVTVREDATNENIANMTGDPSTMFLEVETDLTNITSSGLDSVFIGDDYYTVLTASAGHTLPDEITISMGGDQEVGPNEFLYNKNTGELIVFGVTAALTITAEAD